MGGRWYMNLSPGGWSPREEKQEREPPVLRPAPRARESAFFSLRPPWHAPYILRSKLWTFAPRETVVEGEKAGNRRTAAAAKAQRSGNLSSGEKGLPHPRRPDMSPQAWGRLSPFSTLAARQEQKLPSIWEWSPPS